ncbi:MAG: hypothetical protein KDA24_22995 [Deltaproteobacteria bacterium]|nr:hypothetical protein [Deltaproteobacteria bacterium]
METPPPRIPSDPDRPSPRVPLHKDRSVLVFVLIFGVGNLVLYTLTGITLLPLPRF